MDIVDRLELVRKEQDLNGSEFAKTVNLTGSAYSQVKNKTRPPSRRFILEVCKQFNVSEEWLETGQGEMYRQKPRTLDRLSEAVLRVVHTENAFSDIIEVILEMYYEMSEEKQKIVDELFDEFRKRLLFKQVIETTKRKEAFMQGLLHVYTGSGKGKTTAAVGLCVRARGAGLAVVFAQFLKGSATSELQPLASLGVRVVRCKSTPAFYSRMTPAEQARCREEQRRGFAQAVKAAPRQGLLVLDELCCALALGALEPAPVRAFLEARGSNLEVVCTGRGAPEWLLEMADYVTEMRAEKHPFARGIPARRGIEY